MTKDRPFQSREELLKELDQKARDNAFLARLSFDLADSLAEDILEEIILPEIREHTGAIYAHFTLYDAEKKCLALKQIDAKQGILRAIVELAGKKILSVESPVSDENYEMMLRESMTVSESLHDLSFGAIPSALDKAIRGISGMQRFIAMIHVNSGRIFGATLLGFNRSQSLPSSEFLKSYSNITAVALRNKQTERALKSSEATLSAIAENTMEGIWSIDRDYRILYVNEKFRDTYFSGFGVRLKKGDHVLDALPEDVKERWTSWCGRALQNERFTVLDKIYGPEGNMFVEVALNPILVDGQVTGVSIYGRNVTESRKTERMALENEANLKAILENSLESIWSVDLDFKIQYVNRVFADGFKAAFGVHLEKGANILDLIPVAHRENWKNHIERAFRNEQFVFEERFELAFGTIYTETSLNPIVVGKKVVGVSLYTRDITEAKNTEMTLIAAKEKAEESDRLKSAFLANMSHEIRTPMNGILGFASLLREPDLAGCKQMEYLDIIQKSGHRMLNIINDLVTISKIESGQEEITNSVSCLNEQLKFMHGFFGAEAEAKGLTMNMECPLSDEETIFRTDTEKVYAILTNLLKNAIKFTSEGGIEYGYTLKDEMFELYVKDTGIGIPVEKQDSVFSRFVQADSRLSSNYEGAGLGLSISRAYVEMLGGSMWLESEEGKGSCFYFTLPAVSKPKPQDDDCKGESREVNKGSQDRKTILITEDDPVSNTLIQSLLEDVNFSFLSAYNGKEAVDFCKGDEKIDLILMDIKMPVMDGQTAAKLIREIRPEVPIIAQTAFALEAEKKTFSKDFDHYLTKPFQPAEFRSVIHKYLYTK